MTTLNSTAGQGHPYWYEWFVGLAEVVELLNESSNVASVAFQVEGMKGWDDVVVQRKDGSRVCYQVKHSRAANRLSFGDLVQRDEKGVSLLSSLFECWRESGLNDGRTHCVLYTNRDAGSRWSTTESGIQRPPLLSFVTWLRKAIAVAVSLNTLVPEDKWKVAWNEWQDQLRGGTGDEALQFLSCLEIRTTQDDLDGLENRIVEKLSAAFGVGKERVAPTFDSLVRALRKWTTGHAGVNVEELCS